MVQPVVLLSAISFICAALGSEESCYLTKEQEDDCAAVCHPIVKPLLRYFEKIQAKKSQFQNEYSELKKKYTDLEVSHSELQKDKSDLQNRVIEVENLKSQIGSKNLEIKFLKDKISELNKTNELATKILRDDIAKLGEIVKNINFDNGTASPSPTRTVQQQPPPSKDRCPQSQNETEIIQEIQIPGSDPFKVVCYSNKWIGSGWMIVYKHWGKTNYFNRTYEEFERGIKDVETQLENNYFIGLERLHLLTSRNSYELRMSPDTCDNFVVGNRSEGYMVKDTKGCTGPILPNLTKVKFSTWDRDEDGYPDRNLAKEIGYGWWNEPRSSKYFTALSMMIRRKD
ncbi:fibroleukin-like isoform X2 [Drosophila bipectinata]|uniref:fibroleukin-like isoform X2 n=1 Tax=Drosophila bipectinata TaxID=42026 RepID=UPI0038B3F8D1